MKIPTTPQVRRFNAAIEWADALTSCAFDRCDAASLAWVMRLMGESRHAREIKNAQIKVKDQKNNGGTP